MAAAATESRDALRAPAARGPAGRTAVRWPRPAVRPGAGRPGAARSDVPAATADRPAPVATRWAAGLAAASAPLHAWMLAAHSHGAVLTVLMGAMALWCLWCAAGTVPRADPARRGTACPRTRALRHLWAMAAAMAVLHVALLTGFPAGAHRHGGDPVATVTGPGPGAGLMLAIILLEVVVCFACALALRPLPHRGPRH